MKKIIALVLAAAMCLALAACGSAAAPAASSAPAAQEESAPAAEENTRSTKTLKIGAFSNSTVESPYTQAFYRDLMIIKDTYGLEDDQIINVESVYDGTPDVSNIIQQLINEGCNVIIAHSNGYCDDMAYYAAQYPDISFYCYEGTTSDLVNTYTINNLEVMYMLGYLCAQMADSDDIGFIAPMQNSHIIRSADAFAIGAKRFNENAKIKIMWVNSWHDPETDKLCAETLMSEGINTMAYYGSTSAALQACEEGGAFGTGFHLDMHDYAPKATLTSFMWNWVPVMTEMVERYLANDMEVRTIYGSVANDCARLAPLNEDIIPADIVASVNELAADIQANGLDIFAGPIYDNEGNVAVEEGSTIAPEDLFSVMFLVDNVEGSIAK